ncbi:hypothetical protein FBF28_00980 [Candidatus Saccharibacteria bacterium oral taxon 488]|nr:hypothetical protein FBF28_00980 [Candidatus Saccharibacteria bacterium oral taxon 488]
MIDGWGSLSEKGADSTTPEQDGHNGVLAIETTTDKNNRKFAEIPGYEEIRRQIIDSNVSHSGEMDGWSAAVSPENETQGWVDPFEQTPGGRESLAKRIVGGLKGLGEKLSSHGGAAKRKIGEVFNKAAETGKSLKETIGQAAQSAKERRAERRQQREEARENRESKLAAKRQERQERAQKRKDAVGERRKAARNDRNAEVEDLRKRAGLRKEIATVEGEQSGINTEIAGTEAEIEAMSNGELAAAFEQLTTAREAYRDSEHPADSTEGQRLALAVSIAEGAWQAAVGRVNMRKLDLQGLEAERQGLETQHQKALDKIREINERRGERITAAKARREARREARQEKLAGVKEAIGDGFQSASERVSATADRLGKAAGRAAERIGEMRTTVAQRLRDIGSYLSRPVAFMGRKTKETLTATGDFTRRFGRAAVAGHIAFTQEMQNPNSNVGDRV